MYFQQELWLILVGLITAFMAHKSLRSNHTFGKTICWACLLSLIAGEVGMLSSTFFPSDPLGILVTSFAALLGTKISLRTSSTVSRSSKRRPSQSSRSSK